MNIMKVIDSLLNKFIGGSEMCAKYLAILSFYMTFYAFSQFIISESQQ